MFDSSKDRRLAISITMSDGEILTGSIPVGAAGTLAAELNRDGQFLQFRDASGSEFFVQKSAILRAATQDAIKDAKLPTLSNGMSPHKVLQIAEDADAETARQAFMTLVRKYHPDNYSGPNVPKEIFEYATAKFQEINAAHNAIKARADKRAA